MQTPLAHRSRMPPPAGIIAAIGVMLLCLAGTAAILLWTPSSISGNAAATRGEHHASERLVLAPALPAPQPMQQSLLEDTPVAAPAPPAPHQLPVQLAAAAAAPARQRCVHCGNIESIRDITRRAHGSGVGAAGGAITE